LKFTIVITRAGIAPYQSVITQNSLGFKYVKIASRCGNNKRVLNNILTLARRSALWISLIYFYGKK